MEDVRMVAVHEADELLRVFVTLAYAGLLVLFFALFVHTTA